MRTKDEILALLDRLDGSPAEALEDEQTEFESWQSDTRALHKTLREAAVSFANARGGTVVLGVRDRVRSRREAIQGVGEHDATALRRAVYDGTDPHILVEIEELVVPEGALLLVHVPKGIPPHTTSDGTARIRIGNESRPLTGGALARLLADSGSRDLTAEPVADATPQDLDEQEIAELRKLVRREAQSMALADLDDASLVSALGLVGPDGVTRAGILLLGKPDVIAARVPQHEVSFLHHTRPTRYDRRVDMRGPLLAVFRGLELLFAAHGRNEVLQEPGFGQMEIPDLPWEVAREAVLNAVTHRDYFLRQSVVVSLYPDRLEVTSPGGFPPGVTPENALRHPPVHRNELLARAFQTIGIVNRVGLGIDRIYEDLLRSGKGLPRYTTDETHVRLVIPFAVSAGFALFVGQEERKGRRLELDDLLLLRGLAEKGSLDRWSAGAVLQLSPEEAAARLVRMREMGYAVTRGRGRGSAYALAPLLGERIGPVGAATEDGFPADEQGRRRRALSALGKQGRLTNADVRALLGLTRPKAARFLKSLVDEGQARYEGAGRGACVVSSSARRKGGRGQGRAEVAAKVESCRPGPMRPEGGL